MATFTDSNTILLVSNDGQGFHVTREALRYSNLIRTMLNDDEDDEDSDCDCTGESIPITNVDGKTLALVVRWMTYHVENKDVYTGGRPNIPKPLLSSNLSHFLCEWDTAFLTSMENEMLFNMVIAANYLDVPILLDICCAAVASKLTGKSAEEIRQEFNIVNDFTPEEEEAVIGETEWLVRQ